VQATTHYKDAKIIADVSRGLGEAMAGIEIRTLKPEEQLAVRGW
jgi:pyridoxal 5'-phosphate synthase pdxS subunit